MAAGDSARRSSRGSTRGARASKPLRSNSRSVSASPRPDRSRSRSRSRERTSRSRHSRSRSTSAARTSRGSGRHSGRSRSRSAGRDRNGSRRNRHRSSRHRDRSRSRERHRESRKRGRCERSRSHEGRRQHVSSAHRDGESRGCHQRRRRGSDVGAASIEAPEKTESASVGIASEATTTAVTSQASENGTAKVKTEVMTTVALDKTDTPTSQESVATSTGATTMSSQSDTETKPLEASKPTDKSGVQCATTKTASAVKVAVAAPKVDVKSIKMDILKALAFARSTIAGIKGSGPGQGSMTAPAQPHPVVMSTPLTRVEEPDAGGTVEMEQSASPEKQEKESDRPPSGTVAEEPPSTQVASKDVDEFDMFSAAELHGAGLPLSPLAGGPSLVVATAVQSNYDDADGYYKPNIGEVLNSKYRVLGTVGKGVFSTVLRCQRITSTAESESEFVAVKLIRNNEIMREASQTEIKILTEISERDPRDKKHCVRLLDRFDHRNHVALVFESMQMNVREAMKKFGGKGGISIQAVRVFCKHLLVALSHLEACGFVHADIKPDNVLLDEKQTMVKLCDFGSAFELDEGKHDPTPYLVSRFYRAPEIVLGLPYDKAVDMWSVGCCLYEMFTGKVMFPGATNNEMLKLFMELKGKVPNKIIKKHRQAYVEQFQMEPHFTEDNKFCSHELDRVTGKPVLRLMDAMKTRFDLGGALLSAKSSTDDRKQVLELRNLLERMFTLDPSKRITPKDALAHPFVKTEGKQATS